jgi:predicted lipid-binding transport protein (Tim44 family)
VVQIVIFAMVALFVALRLYSVLGKRTGHEQQPLPKPVEGRTAALPMPRTVADAAPEAPDPSAISIESGATEGVRAIVAADPSFDPGRFLNGAKSAYRMVLEAFWKSDEEELRRLADDDVVAAFREAIEMRDRDGHVLDNRLVAIERAVIERAALKGQMASVTVRFDADIAAVTRDKDGNVVAGSLTDAVPTHDVWTFARNVRADDPNWMLVETDESA